MMGRFICRILALETVFMIPACIISLFDRNWNGAQSFLAAMGITLKDTAQGVQIIRN